MFLVAHKHLIRTLKKQKQNPSSVGIQVTTLSFCTESRNCYCKYVEILLSWKLPLASCRYTEANRPLVIHKCFINGGSTAIKVRSYDSFCIFVLTVETAVWASPVDAVVMSQSSASLLDEVVHWSQETCRQEIKSVWPKLTISSRFLQADSMMPFV